MEHPCQRVVSTRRTRLRGLGIFNEAGFSENGCRITRQENIDKTEGKRKVKRLKQFALRLQNPCLDALV